MSVAQAVMEIPAAHQLNVFGQFDCNIKKIERAFGVTFVNRGETIRLSGTEEAVGKARSVVDTLLELSRRGNTVTEQNVDYTISMSFSEKSSDVLEIDKEIICRTISGKPVKPKTVGQKKYVDEIRSKMIVFGVGPAGTGKTYLAMAMAIDAFKKQEVSRIILTRPAIEAGEKLGFLPGDLQSKIDPYLRPLYDALYQIMGAESFNANMEKGLIEVAPLAYMRGRTLDNAFIILDEAIEIENNLVNKGRKPKTWLLFENEEYLFKTNSSNYEIWSELLASELGKQCKIEMAEYDIGIYKGKYGVQLIQFSRYKKDFKYPLIYTALRG